MNITSDLIETDLADLRRVGFEKISSGPGAARHRLAAASFAGDGSARITRDLWSAEESRRMLLVATLLAEIERDPAVLGPLPPAAGVLDALAAAQRNGPAGVRRLLLDPQTGSGCAYALRRLRGAAGPDPLWVDLGVVHALALAAAAQAGLTWSTRLPVRRGKVAVPGLGLARLGAGATTVEAHTEDGEIRVGEVLIGSEVDKRWWPLRSVRVGTDLPLTVRLDDLDPFRELAGPVPPARLGPAAVRRWHRLIADAWELLCRDHRPEAEAIAAGIVAIAPRRAAGSTSGVFGRVVLAEPPDPVTLAVTLVHEYQHLELGALRQLVPLTGADDGSLYYAPWRDDPCPLADLMRGAHAFFGITRFWRIRRDTADGAFEYAYARRQTVESVHTVLAAPGLTARGRELFEGLRDRLGAWSGDPLDPRIDQLATITADSHRIGWRLRHFRPRDADVAALAGRWAQHRTPQPRHPAPAAIRPHPAARWEQRIPAMARRQACGALSPAGGDPLAAGENALLARDPQSARTVFAGAIGRYSPAAHGAGTEMPDEEARAWTGLAMSLAAAGDTAAASALSRRPDLVRAVYAESRTAAGPADVAAWLAPVLTTGE